MSEPQDSNGSPPTGNPFAKTTLLALTTHMLGASRKVENNTDGVDVDADSEMYTITATLLKCPEYDAIKTRIGQLKRVLSRPGMIVPGGKRLFKDGTYPIINDRMQDAIAELRKAEAELAPLVDAFCAVYEQRRDEAMKRLRKLAKRESYPPVSEVRRFFGMEYDWFQLGMGSPQGVNPSLVAEEQRRLNGKYRQACEEGILAIRTLYQQVIDEFITALKPKEDGKKRAIARPLDKLKELLRDFESVIAGTDSELESVSAKLQAILAGVDLESLKDSASTRKFLDSRLGEVKAAVDKAVGVAVRRKIVIED
jgi:hypothetical protein